MEISDETIEALRILREAAMYSDDLPAYVREAFKRLDDADVFEGIDAVADGKADVRRPDLTKYDVHFAYAVYNLDGSRDEARTRRFTNIEAKDEADAALAAQNLLIDQLKRALRIEQAGQVAIVGTTVCPSLPD